MVVDTINHKNFKIDIVIDDSPESPREWENIGKIATFRKDYGFSDTYGEDVLEELLSDVGVNLDTDYFERLDEDDAKNFIEKKIEENYIILDLYKYEHGCFLLNTDGFSCRWDSCQIGYVYVSKEEAKEKFLWKKISKKRVSQIEEHLKSEVSVLSNYVNGEVYGYSVAQDDEIIASCFGFYGSDHEESGLLENAKDEIDFYIAEKKKKRKKEPLS